ncbi:MAG: methyltransferase domain-containing protein [Betaproteobacteria bacterium]|nr:methyltransferase domain-containing protein [Betaproteobacteria bacterium]
MKRRAFMAWFAALAVQPAILPARAQQPAKPRRLEQFELDVPFVPTKQEVVEAMLDLAGVTAKDVVYDLGCGDGRIVVTAAHKYGARGVGVDIDPERIKEADERAKKDGVTHRVEFILGNLFDADIHDATVVTLYLLPEINLKLKPKLLRELKPGTRIVSHDFSMGRDWPPEKTVRIGRDTIYLWTIPKR